MILAGLELVLRMTAREFFASRLEVTFQQPSTAVAAIARADRETRQILYIGRNRYAELRH
jgi:hypothetical protein